MRIRILLSVLFVALRPRLQDLKSPPAAERRFPIEGRVVAVDPAAHTITLDHHEVVGYMKAMTMPFPVRDAWVFNVVHPGDTVQATLVVSDEPIWKTSPSPRLAPPPISPHTSPMHLPQTGEEVPDFHFVNQEGRHDSPGAVPRTAAADHLHLFPLSPAGLLHSDEQ